ncbi:phosphoribosyltransferase domain-containing protein [Rhabdobacter roseus]|uniref:Pyrimidine operon attenuation protein/uracil phosphoribosyltransferase n=1 Tax=Rhabdobacter roseus TaxID=1655419 RepID=A0A840TMV8_9BACT|nr:phosphoribosyltransferase family protein [Rhabdobacter roseus]MBB5284275.1 pyrimidine operon attenuation protein/uracil phosphoribosyltransferase [Rhabdobacter roseus]
MATPVASSFRQQILTPLQARQKIRRIAFEIYEQNFEESGVVIAGIVGEGYAFAQRLVEELREISPLKTTLIEVRFDKSLAYQSPIAFGGEDVALDGQVVVVVDDVLNTGRTLAFALQPFLKVPIKKLQVAVIVDRNHRCFPVSADYVGYSLSTTFNEHVKVVLSDPEQEGVYLQ